MGPRGFAQKPFGGVPSLTSMLSSRRMRPSTLEILCSITTIRKTFNPSYYLRGTPLASSSTSVLFNSPRPRFSMVSGSTKAKASKRKATEPKEDRDKTLESSGSNAKRKVEDDSESKPTPKSKKAKGPVVPLHNDLPNNKVFPTKLTFSPKAECTLRISAW